MLHVRAVSPPDLTGRVMALLSAQPCVLGLSLRPDSVRNPDGDAIVCDVLTGVADEVLRVVAAMVVGPEYAAVTSVGLGIDHRSRPPVREGLAALIVGFRGGHRDEHAEQRAGADFGQRDDADDPGEHGHHRREEVGCADQVRHGPDPELEGPRLEAEDADEHLILVGTGTFKVQRAMWRRVSAHRKRRAGP